MSAKILAIGDFTVDVLVGPMKAVPDWGQEIEVASHERRLGGNIGNFAVAAHLLGLDLFCTGPIGDDENGRWIGSELRKLGFDGSGLQVVKGGETSETIALVRDDGERVFLTYPGVLPKLADTIRVARFPRADVAFFSGWCQPPRIAAAELVGHFDRLHAQGTVVAMDLCWLDASWANRSDVFAVLRAVDFILMNSDELGALIGINDADEALTRLSEQLSGARNIIVKRGALGAMGLGFSGDLISVAARPVKAAVAVGAGDCFNAALIDALFNHKVDLASAMRSAVNFTGAFLAGDRRTTAIHPSPEIRTATLGGQRG